MAGAAQVAEALPGAVEKEPEDEEGHGSHDAPVRARDAPHRPGERARRTSGISGDARA